MTPSEPDSRAAARREKTTVALLAALSLLATFAVYRPDRDLPFDFLDFSEFLPLLQRGDSVLSQLRALLSYYAEQGRFNPVGHATIVAKWLLWGDSSPAWQWTRFATMWAVIVLTYRLLCRIGISRPAALAASAVFLFAPPAVDGWTRLTMAEPLGVILLLVACLVALRPSDQAHSERRIGLEFAALCVILVLLKEMLAATLLLPIALVVALPDKLCEYSRWMRVRTLSIAAVVAVLLAGIPVTIVALTAHADAYTAAFGSQIRPLGDVVAEWSLGIAPFSVGTSFPPSLAGLALLLLIALLVAGWTARLRIAGQDRRSDYLLLAIGLLFPLIGAATYLPWPSYNRFYAIPCLLGGALLAAGAVSGLESRSSGSGRAGLAVWFLFLVFAAADAAGQASRLAGRQRINQAVVTRLAEDRGRADTVFVGTDQRPPTLWQGIGPTLQRYGEALGYSMPQIISVPCEESRRRALEGRNAVLFYSSLCSNPLKGDTLIERYRRLRLPSLRAVTDSIRVDLVIPSQPARTIGVPGV